MPHRHRTHRKHRQLPRFSLRDALIALFAVLFLLMLALDYNVSRAVWPAWLSNHRDTFIGLLALAIVALVFFAPAIVEVNRHPRPLSGPGHDPRHHGEG